MKVHMLALSLLPLTIAAAAAQPPPLDPTQRAEAIATRRAQRDSDRSERMPSRPVTLRAPLPLPVALNRPAGGPPAGLSCPATEACALAYSVPDHRSLVVTGLWSATEIRCDGVALGATPPGGQLLAPMWHCSRSLEFKGGPAAGFAGYLFPTPDQE